MPPDAPSAPLVADGSHPESMGTRDDHVADCSMLSRWELPGSMSSRGIRESMPPNAVSWKRQRIAVTHST